MTGKTRTGADQKLIKKLFDLEPLDWARYPNGKLVFIAPNGSKAIYTSDQLEKLLADKKPAPKSAKKSNPDKQPTSKDKTKTAAAPPAKSG